MLITITAKLCILLLLSERGVIELKKNHVVYYIIATALFCGIVCLIVASYNKTNGDENMKQCFTTEDLATEYSARDCAARPLKLSIHSGGIERACRRR